MTEGLLDYDDLLNRWDDLTKTERWSLGSGELHNIIDAAKARLDAVLALDVGTVGMELQFNGFKGLSRVDLVLIEAAVEVTRRAASGEPQ